MPAVNVQKTLTAQWKRKTYTITFDANAPSGVTITGVPQALTVQHGEEAVVPSATLTWEGKSFTGKWTIAKDGTGTFYRADGKIKNVTDDIILYAQGKMR